MIKFNLLDDCCNFDLDKLYIDFMYLLKNNDINLYNYFKEIYFLQQNTQRKQTIKFCSRNDTKVLIKELQSMDLSLVFELLTSLINKKEWYSVYKNINASCKYYNTLVYLSKKEKLENPYSFDFTWGKFDNGKNDFYDFVVMDQKYEPLCKKNALTIITLNEYYYKYICKKLEENENYLSNNLFYIHITQFINCEIENFYRKMIDINSLSNNVNKNTKNNKLINNKIKTNINKSNINVKYDELIKNLNDINYNDYLKTKHWKHFKNQAYEYFNNKCCLCGSVVKLNLHHNNYKNRGRETFSDVILLCNKCHSKFHNK